MIEVKAAIKRVAVPDRYEVNRSLWLKNSSNIGGKRYEIAETSLTVFANDIHFSNVKFNLRFRPQF